ncbi:hypothetical protein Tco_1481577 [Tanacetum coccineum]
MVVQDQEEMGEASSNPTDPHHTPTIIPPSTGPTTNVADKAVNKEMDDSLERAATTATSLDADIDKGNINKTQSKATLNKPSSIGTSSVLDLETTKTTQGNEIASLRRRFKNLEKKNRSRTHKLKRIYKVGSSRRVESFKDEGLGKEDASKQGRISDIDANAGISLMVVETEVASKDVNLIINEVTLAQALVALKSAKPNADKVKVHDKGKGIMVEEPLKMKKKDQISFDKQEAKRLQAGFDKEERLAREKAQQEQEANVALTEE